jgi:hypothetical protein
MEGTYRNMTVADLKSRGLILIEIAGFFTLGEVIGRKHLIGYDVILPDKYDGNRAHYPKYW